jgi:hypothetical protein
LPAGARSISHVTLTYCSILPTDNRVYEEFLMMSVHGNDKQEPRIINALRKLLFAARTSGGTAGRDNSLCAACDEAEAALADIPLRPKDEYLATQMPGWAGEDR